MNLLLLDAAELDGERAVVRGRRARHLVEVLRVVVGQRVRAGIVGGAVGDAEVLAIGADFVDLGIACSAPPPRALDVSLIVAVPRPKVLSRLLQHVAAWGVARIDLVNAWRVDKSYLASSRLSAADIDLALRLGAEQGMTTHLPAVTVHPRLMPFLDTTLPTLPPARRLLADARTDAPLESALPPGSPDPVLLAIGPEGGWIDRERDTFISRAFTPITLGAAILRVEAAVTAALAQLALLRRLPRSPGVPGTVAPAGSL